MRRTRARRTWYRTRPRPDRRGDAVSAILPVKMPKWGLSMQEGKIVHWWKEPGEEIGEGDDLVDVETTKITNTVESTGTGTLRRIVAAKDQTLPVGSLLAVIANATTSDDEIDRFVEEWQKNFVPESDETARKSALELRMVEVAGRSLRLGVTKGQGIPVVLLHGFGADLDNWLFNIDALAAAAPVIAIDLPGHGASTKDVGNASIARLAESIVGVLDTLGVSKAHLVGHSLGAAVALLLALNQPPRVGTLTLIAPAGLPGTRVSEDFLTGFVEAERRQQLKPVLEMLVVEPGLVSRDMVDNVLRSKRLDGAQEAMSKLRDRILAGDDFHALQARLAEWPPALIIAGRKDAVVTGLAEASLPPNWRIAWIDDAGHMPHVERAGVVNRLILARIEP